MKLQGILKFNLDDMLHFKFVLPESVDFYSEMKHTEIINALCDMQKKLFKKKPPADL